MDDNIKKNTEALNKLKNLCSRGEKCVYDIKQKLTTWGITEIDAESIINDLIENKFIDENRYAVAFVRDKFRFAHWGTIKIRAALKSKNISDEIISNALEEIDSSIYTSDLTIILQKKIKTIKAKNITELKAKLIRFGLSRGFEYDLVYNCTTNILKDLK